MGGINTTRNGLWLVRKRLGLRQKQIAYLLNHKTNDQVSRYEKGARLPGLKMLLQLEIVYGIPARVLFREYYQELQTEIWTRAKENADIHQTLPLPLEEVEPLAEFCPYLELLKNPRLSEPENAEIRQHVIQLMRKLTYK